MDVVARIYLVLAAVFVRNLVSAQVIGAEYERSIVASSMMRNVFDQTMKHIRVLPGTLYETKNITYTRYIGLRNFNTQLLSIEVDYARNRLFIYDSNTASLYAIENFNWRQEFSNLSLTHFHAGFSRHSSRIALDWVSNNIYWTDPLFGWIVIQSGSNVNDYKILIDNDIDKPYALAVDPVNKYMFWSDTGKNVKIVRASLSGTNAKAIITTGLNAPTSVDVDRDARKLIFVDNGRDTLESCNFDGSDRLVIRRLSGTSFYDVAVYKELVAVTEVSNGTLNIFNKNTGERVNFVYLTDNSPFLSVAIYTPETQPSQVDRCSSFGCSDICLNENTGPVCMCKEGYKLNQDGKTCSEDLGVFHRAVVFSNATKICMLDFRSLTTNMHRDTINCFLGSGTSISLFDIDMNKRRVVYVDGTNLISVKIATNPQKRTLTSSKTTITGVAIDWRDNNVYWSTGEAIGNISVVSEETGMGLVLIQRNLSYPKQLRIAPFHNMMVWISGPVGSQKIEKSLMDGSNRVTLFTSKSSVDMKGLTVDAPNTTLYFLDNTIMKSCNFDGKHLTVLAPSSSVLIPTMILAYKNFLIVPDKSIVSNVIKVYEKKPAPTLKYQMSNIDLDTLKDLHVLDPGVQPPEQGPCDILNGGCEQICIPIGKNRVCQCEYGYTLDLVNKRTCASSPLTNNFLVVSDWTHNSLYQISLVNDDVRAVDTNTYGSPIAVAYNYATQDIFWSTNEYLHRLSLKDHNYKVLFNTGFLNCHADRFAVDYPSGNIYYTANPTAVAGFIGIGVVSPQGLHKRLISMGSKPRDIVLDAVEGLMFWTDHGAVPPFVAKANMDGTGLSYIVRQGLVWPNGLAIDTQANVLYVTDGQKDIIYKCTYVGVCTIHYTDRGSHLMDILLLGDYLYYTAWNRPYISKLHTTNPVNVIKVGYKPELGRLDSLTVYSSLFNQSESTHCSSNNGLGPCSTFCLPKTSGYACACEDNVALRSDRKTCENVELPTTTTTTTTTTPTTTTPTTTTPSTTTPTTTTPSTTTPTTTTPTTTTPTTTTPTTTTPTTTTKTTSTSTLPPSSGTSASSKVPPSSTLSTTPETEGTTKEVSAMPTATLISVIVAIVVVLGIVIIILVCVIVKRSNNGGESPGTAMNQFDSSDIAYLTTPPENTSRPDSTYDLITFDIPAAIKTDDDNAEHDYMRLNKKPTEYEKLSFKRTNDVPIQELRPSAVQNIYERIPSSTSNVLLDDYLKPATHSLQPSTDSLEPSTRSHNFSDDAEDLFNSPVYQDSTPSNTNPKLPFSNVSTIS